MRKLLTLGSIAWLLGVAGRIDQGLEPDLGILALKLLIGFAILALCLFTKKEDTYDA